MATKKAEVSAKEFEMVVNPEAEAEPKKPARKKKAAAAEAPEQEAASPAEPEKPVKKTRAKKTEEPAAEQKEQKIDPDEKISQMPSRLNFEVSKANRTRFGYEQAGRDAKKEMYGHEYVATEFGDEEFETESTKLREDYLELVASAKSGRILEGVISGFRYAGERLKSTVLAEIQFGTGLFVVLIPAYLIYDYDIEKYVNPDQLKTIENNIMRRINSKVKFVVRQVLEGEMVAYADHLEAMQSMCYDNYIRPQRDGIPNVFNGRIVKSQVVYVSNRGIIVDALGCEISIHKSELSHSYVGDARAEFSVGDYVNVRVNNIKQKKIEKYGNTYTLITAEGSVKAATKDNRGILYNQYKVDGMYAAEVTFVEEAGVFCRFRGGLDCLCAAPKYGDIPRRGQSIMVRVTGKDEEKKFIYGRIVNA